MSGRALAVGIGLLLLTTSSALSFSLDAAGDGEMIEAAALRIGDGATYVGPTNISIEVAGASSALNPRGEREDSLALVLVEDDHRLIVHLNPASLRVVGVHAPCTIAIAGFCDPDWESWLWEWHGGGGLFGASVLSGRPLEIGTLYLLPGGCEACEGQLTLWIEAPDGASPATTDYVVSPPDVPRLGLFEMRLHMTSAHPFPLRVELGSESWDLRSVTRGEQPVVADWSVRTDVAGLLSTAAFEHGVPAQGEADPTVLPWSAVRERYPAEAAVGGRDIIEFGYSRSNTTSTYGPDALLPTIEDVVEHAWTLSLPHQTSAETREFTRTDTYPALIPETPLTSAWSYHTSASEGTLPVDACAEAVPLWDAFRVAEALGFVRAIGGVRYAASDCATHFVEATGETFGMFSERVRFDASSGVLVGALLRTDRPIPDATG